MDLLLEVILSITLIAATRRTTLLFSSYIGKASTPLCYTSGCSRTNPLGSTSNYNTGSTTRPFSNSATECAYACAGPGPAIRQALAVGTELLEAHRPGQSECCFLTSAPALGDNPSTLGSTQQGCRMAHMTTKSCRCQTWQEEEAAIG